jgi:hypothetical protein
LCQVFLLIEAFAPLRFIFRSFSFSLGIMLWIFLSGRPNASRPHPAFWGASLVIFLLFLQFFHPDSPLWGAPIMQFLLYCSILSPIFWVSKIKVDEPVLRKFIGILWGFHILSVGFGILQVKFPGQFQPAIAAVSRDNPFLEGLMITLSNGEKIFRPMGLTDIPGGVARSGFYAVICGMAFFLLSKSNLQKILCVLSMGAGIASIILSNVRVHLVVTAVCLMAFIVALFMTRRQLTAMKIAAVLGIFITVGGLWAFKTGGQDIEERFSSLFAADATDVYHENRGKFLQDTIEQFIPTYPLGAGLGRWGMATSYFYVKDTLWAEIQPTGWVFDGGVPLLLLYYFIVIYSVFITFRIAKIKYGPGGKALGLWGAFLCAYNISSIAMTFSYSVFISQSGQEFWLLNTTLYAAYWSYAREMRSRQSALALNSMISDVKG